MYLQLFSVSTEAPDGKGNYGITSDTETTENFTGGLVYNGKNTGVLITGTGSIKSGELVVTQKDSHIMKGTFNFTRLSSNSSEKIFTGTFTFTYQ